MNDVFLFRLKEASLSIMEKYGSQLIKIIKFRDSFVMIGQKGLARGKAIEMVEYLFSISLLIFILFRSINPKQIVISLLPHISVVVQNFHVCFYLDHLLHFPLFNSFSRSNYCLVVSSFRDQQGRKDRRWTFDEKLWFTRHVQR